jgi:hypothetical protein
VCVRERRIGKVETGRNMAMGGGSFYKESPEKPKEKQSLHQNTPATCPRL